MEQIPFLKVTCLSINQGICKNKDSFLCSQQPMKSTALHLLFITFVIPNKSNLCI